MGMTKRAKSLSKGKSKRSRIKASRPKVIKRARARTLPVQRKPAARDPLDTFVDAAAQALNLPVEPAWKPAIRTNLDVTLRLAAVFAEFPLPDDAEPAPVFVA